MNPRSGRPHGRRGNYSVLMGSMMFVVCGFGALGVDVSLITMADLQAQATADAASHAALVAFRQNRSVAEGNAAAAFVVNTNKIAMGTGTIESGYPQYGTYDFEIEAFDPGLTTLGNANAVRVRLARADTNAVNLLLAPILGVPTHDVHAEAITAQQLRAVMLIQDMSCSMMGSGTGSAVNLSRIANQSFLTYMSDHAQTGDMLGLAMFAQKGAREISSTRPYGSGTNNASSLPWAPLVEIAPNLSTLTTRLDGIADTGGAEPSTITGQVHPRDSDIGSCTNPAIAIDQAVYQLVNNTDDTYFRGIVFMSDGLPNCNGSGNWDDTADDRAVASVDAAWTQGIHVWTIVFHNGSFDPTFMAGLTRGIGFSQVSPDAADLPEMYEAVARSLPLALVE
ncbi:MAG: TadG family pilus assembly protein [Myxococcota bacterium]